MILPEFLASGSGRLLLTKNKLSVRALSLDPPTTGFSFSYQSFLQQNIETWSPQKTDLFLYFYKYQLDDQHRQGAISMVFIRRTVCGFTMTEREKRAGVSAQTPTL